MIYDTFCIQNYNLWSKKIIGKNTEIFLENRTYLKALAMS